MDANLNEDGKGTSQPAVETPGSSGNPAAQTGQNSNPEPQEDYRTKFAESTRENQRIMAEAAEYKKQLEQVSDVMSVLQDDPELLQQVEEKYQRKFSSAVKQPVETGNVQQAVIANKVQETVSPIAKEVDQLRKERVEEVTNAFWEKHPEAAEGTPVWKAVIDWLPAMQAKGLPLKQGLEKAFDIVRLEQATQSGDGGNLTKSIAAASGGAAGAATGNPALGGQLTPEEQKVAAELGVKPEAYAKRKHGT